MLTRKLFSVAVLVNVAAGCADDPGFEPVPCDSVELVEPPYLRLRETGELVMLTDSEKAISLKGRPIRCVGISDLDILVESEVVEAFVEKEDPDNPYLRVVSHGQGRGAISVSVGDDVVDTLTLAIATPLSFELVPGQNQFDEFPAVPRPWGVITNHGVSLHIDVITTLGRLWPFYNLSTVLFDIASEGNIIIDGGFVPTLTLLEAGEYAGKMYLDRSTSVSGSITAVAPEEVVDLTVRISDQWISVLGVTEDGRYIIGLDPSLRIGGQRFESAIGTWLFEAFPRSGDEVTVYWNGIKRVFTLP